MEAIWTVAGDETSWPEWANRMATTAASETVRQLVSDLKPGKHQWAIDIGCGTGRSFLPLNQQGYQVVGIDPVEEAIKASQARANNEALLAWPVLATADHLPMKSESVRVVFAIGTLFHLSLVELEDALLEIKRVLSVGGKAVLHFLDDRDWRKTLGNQRNREDIPNPSYQAVVTCFCSEDTIRKMIEVSGLAIQHSLQKLQNDEEGERRDCFFYCIREK